MRRTFLLLPLIFLAIAADPNPCPEPADPTRDDLKKMQGSWEMTRAVKGGKAPPRPIAGVVLEISKDQLVIREPGGRKPETVTFKLDARKNPREIDIHPPQGRKVVKGIYKLSKNELTICFSEPGRDRPTHFDEKAAGFLVFKQMKK